MDYGTWYDGDPPKPDDKSMVLLCDGQWCLLPKPVTALEKSMTLFETTSCHPDIPSLKTDSIIVPLNCNCQPCHTQCRQMDGLYVYAYEPA